MILNRVKLIIGLLSSGTGTIFRAEKSLKNMFGQTDYESELMEFTHTDYYDRELGAGIKRKFLSFDRSRDLSGLFKVKLATNKLEKKFSVSGRRSINIDPGYLDLSKVVLFSTKDFTHRIYLGKGIFAEVTLFYKDNSFNAWPWTYPDYRTSSYIGVFNRIREIHKSKLSKA